MLSRSLSRYASLVPDHGHADPSLFLQKRIPTAQFFNIDKIADTSVPLPHMLSTPEYFKQCVEKLGISTNDEIVVYVLFACACDFPIATIPTACSPLLVPSGCSVSSTPTSRSTSSMVCPLISPSMRISGGLVRWNAEGRKTESGACAAPAKGNFKTEYHPELVRNMKDILNMIDQFNVKIRLFFLMRRRLERSTVRSLMPVPTVVSPVKSLRLVLASRRVTCPAL